jgi:adenylate kinase
MQNYFGKLIKKNFSQSLGSNKYIILMMGAPGVGKGTFSKMLSKDYNLPEFSTGDELRKIINSNQNENDEDIKKIKQTVKEGKLVDDTTMFNIVQKRLKMDDTKNGIILDGYPRNLNQAKQFNQVNLVVDIFLDDKVLIPKILARRICKCCGNNYNIYKNKENGYDMDPLLPKKDVNKCDDCGTELSMREDDKEEIIKDRLKVYREHTFPIMDYYKKQNILISFEPKKGKKDYLLLKALIDKFRNK